MTNVYIEYLSDIVDSVCNYTFTTLVANVNINDIVYELDLLYTIGSALSEEGVNVFFDETKSTRGVPYGSRDFFSDIVDVEEVILKEYTLNVEVVPEYELDIATVQNAEHIEDDLYVMYAMEELGGTGIGYNEYAVGTYSEKDEALKALDIKYSQSKEEILANRIPFQITELVEDYAEQFVKKEYDLATLLYASYTNPEETDDLEGYEDEEEEELEEDSIFEHLDEEDEPEIQDDEDEEMEEESFYTLQDSEVSEEDIILGLEDEEDTDEEENVYTDANGFEILQSDLDNLQESVDYRVSGTIVEFLSERGSQKLGESNGLGNAVLYKDENGNSMSATDEVSKNEDTVYSFEDEDEIEEEDSNIFGDTGDSEDPYYQIEDDETEDEDDSDIQESDQEGDYDYVDDDEEETEDEEDSIFSDVTHDVDEDSIFEEEDEMEDGEEGSPFDESYESSIDLFADDEADMDFDSEDDLAALEDGVFDPFGDVGAGHQDADFKPNANEPLNTTSVLGDMFEHSTALDTRLEESSFSFGGMSESMPTNVENFNTSMNSESKPSAKYQQNDKFANMLLKAGETIFKAPSLIVGATKKSYKFLVVDEENS